MKKQYVLIHAEPYFDDDNMVLLVMKNRPEWQKGFFNLVGGKIEPEEDIIEAALRELKEETGYQPHRFSVNGMDKMGTIEAENELVHCFCCPVNDEKDPKPRDGETEIVRWYPWASVRDDKRLIPSLRIILPLMMAGVYDWHLHVQDSLMNKDSQKVQLTIPSHMNERFKEKKSATQILENGKMDSKWGVIL